MKPASDESFYSRVTGSRGGLVSKCVVGWHPYFGERMLLASVWGTVGGGLGAGH